ncbi:LuxR family transcriptional regulator [Entomohabitans teleogrylli]|uniref:LuxR family transcriptional regulator n=1 Tax=Entomohabitans teleogrylli TaxID=1384589 RepID=UPI00073D8EE1|nr:LuxR family transcriptional regulator [Entomohabitans teleogrylli]
MRIHFFDRQDINESIKKSFDEYLAEYGKITYAYAIMNKKNPAQMVIINNHKEWFDRYIDNNYQFIDPVIIRSLNTIVDFSWDKEILTQSHYSLPRIFDEGISYNIDYGHTFVIHDYIGNLAVLSLIKYKESDIDVMKNRNMLLSFFISEHQKTIDLYHEEHQKNLICLSPREREILYWTGRGKTYPEIAVILSISQRTVKFHISNVLRKLGVSNARHALRVCVELKLLED